MSGSFFFGCHREQIQQQMIFSLHFGEPAKVQCVRVGEFLGFYGDVRRIAKYLGP